MYLPILPYFIYLILSILLYLPYFIYLILLYLLFSFYHLSLFIDGFIASTPIFIDYTSLIAVLNNGIWRVLSRFSPLEDLEENKLLKAVAVIGEDLDIIIGNNYYKKARIIFVKLLSISFKVFFLCTISITLDVLSKLY